MRIAFLVYLAAAVLLTFPKCADAFDYDVDFPPSGKKGFQNVCITIDGCESCTIMKNEDLEAFSKQIRDEEKKPGKLTLREKLILSAIKRSENGCQ